MSSGPNGRGRRKKEYFTAVAKDCFGLLLIVKVFFFLLLLTAFVLIRVIRG
jgi:hypothetical protein